MIHTPEDGIRTVPLPYKQHMTNDATELLHAYVACLKLSADHAKNMAGLVERFVPDEVPLAVKAYEDASAHIDLACWSLYYELFGGGSCE